MRWNRIIKWMALLSVLFFSVLMFKISIPYFKFNPYWDFLITKVKVYHVLAWRYAFYIHVGFSSFVLLLGPWNFSKTLLKKHKRLHRTIGMLYIGIILLFSGPSGLIMALYANGGFAAQISFTILSLLWMLFTFLAYYYIKRKDYERHTNYIMYSYALTLSAVCLRFYILLISKTMGIHGFTDRTAIYVFVSYASWIPNLLFAKYLINKRFLHLSNRKAIE